MAQGALVVGTKSYLHSLNMWNSNLDFFVFGFVLVFMLYHLYLFKLRLSENTTLIFVGLCLMIFFETLSTSRSPLLSFIGFFPLLKYRLAYSCVVVGPILFNRFVCETIKGFSFSKNLYLLLNTIGMIFFATIVLTPLSFFPKYLYIFQLFFVLSVSIGALQVLINVFQREVGSGYAFFGYISVAFSSLNDVFDSLGVIDSVPMVGYGVLIFILFQANLLASRFNQDLVQAKLNFAKQVHRNKKLQGMEAISKLKSETMTRRFNAVCASEVEMAVISQSSMAFDSISSGFKNLIPFEYHDLEDLLVLSNCSKKEMSKILQVIKNSFDNQLDHFNKNVKLLPLVLEYEDNSDQQKIVIEFRWLPMPDEINTPESIILLIKDISTIHQTMNEINLMEREATIVQELSVHTLTNAENSLVFLSHILNHIRKTEKEHKLKGFELNYTLALANQILKTNCWVLGFKDLERKSEKFYEYLVEINKSDRSSLECLEQITGIEETLSFYTKILFENFLC